jgi:peptidoglycan hydrolase-like protein with peptidoglycan-binding domain
MKKIIAITGFFGMFLSLVGSASAAYFNAAPLSQCQAHITRTLQIGSENNDVVVLQQLLVNAGFLDTNPNGYFGYQTKQAVRSFQANNGISPTGIVGPSTRDAVNESLCDTDLVDNTSYTSYNDNGYGYNGYGSGVTYVGNNDPFVRVITPPTSVPTVYTTPYNTDTVANLTVVQATTPLYTDTSYTSVTPSIASSFSPNQVQSTGIVYNPSTGYSYGIVPQSGSVTVSSPVVNSVYNEGDTVNVVWGSNNLVVSQYTVLLESTTVGQSRVVAVTSGNSYSFVLTKELLDSVCAGTCNSYGQGQSSFRVVVSTPTTDIAGNTSTLRAAVAPITINRPFGFTGIVNLSASQTPVNSGQIFKLYINVPTSSSWNYGMYGNGYMNGNYSLKIHALCPASVAVSIAGTPCGQDFVVPFAATQAQQEIPTTITNTSWYKQDVIYEIVVSNLNGQVVGSARTTVTVNALPFNW